MAYIQENLGLLVATVRTTCEPVLDGIINVPYHRHTVFFGAKYQLWRALKVIP